MSDWNHLSIIAAVSTVRIVTGVSIGAILITTILWNRKRLSRFDDPESDLPTIRWVLVAVVIVAVAFAIGFNPLP